MGRATIVILLTAALTLAGLSGPGGAWLCLGPDGHVGFKAFQGAPCRGRLVEAPSDHTAEPPCHDEEGPSVGCGPCVDIPLKAYVAVRPDRRAARDATPDESASVTTFGKPNAACPPQGRAWRPPPPTMCLAPPPDRTVVLLI